MCCYFTVASDEYQPAPGVESLDFAAECAECRGHSELGYMLSIKYSGEQDAP